MKVGRVSRTARSATSAENRSTTTSVAEIDRHDIGPLKLIVHQPSTDADLRELEQIRGSATWDARATSDR